jgi:hypothetical protein
MTQHINIKDFIEEEKKIGKDSEIGKESEDQLHFLDKSEINKLLGLGLDINSLEKDDMDMDDINKDIVDTDTELDIKWVEENEKIDSLYKDFYKEDVTFINMHYIYINTSNEIERIKEDKYFLPNKNLVTKDEVISIIHTNSKSQNKKYSILSILKYNISLEPEQIPFYLKKKYKQVSFLNSLRNICDIHFEKTIHMFHDLNDLYFLFYENADKKSINVKNMKKTMKNRVKRK